MNRTADGIVFGDNLEPKEITQIIMSCYASSPQIKDIEDADDYFDGKSKISKKLKVYYDKDRNAIDNPNASNSRIASNFLRILVQQKQDYAFSKSFVMKISNGDEKEIDSDKDDYVKRWKTLCDDTLFKFVYKIAEQVINQGVAWTFVWIDENGVFRLKDVDSSTVYPIWTDKYHDTLDKLVYHYFVEKYDSLNPNLYEYAEYWTNEERRLFSITESYKDMSGDDYFHLTSSDGGVSWGRIPFVAFKVSEDEKPLLNHIRQYIDAYDELMSKSVDGLIDDLDPLLVFKGVSPSVGDLLEARELAKMTRTISLDTDGDAHYIQADTSIDAHLKELQMLRRDIMKFGYGVDYEDERFSGNPNQMLIKSLYQNLDTFTDRLERQFQTFIDNLKYFFDKWCDFSGIKSFDECQKYKILVKLDRVMMINQSELIKDTISLTGTGVSQKTLLEFNPVVQDVDVELERIDEERKQSMEQNEMFNFESISKNNEKTV